LRAELSLRFQRSWRSTCSGNTTRQRGYRTKRKSRLNSLFAVTRVRRGLRNSGREPWPDCFTLELTIKEKSRHRVLASAKLRSRKSRSSRLAIARGVDGSGRTVET